jgi:hypothetical protein
MKKNVLLGTLIFSLFIVNTSLTSSQIKEESLDIKTSEEQIIAAQEHNNPTSQQNALSWISSKWTIIGGCILAGVVVGGAIFAFSKRKNKKTYGIYVDDKNKFHHLALENKGALEKYIENSSEKDPETLNILDDLRLYTICKGDGHENFLENFSTKILTEQRKKLSHLDTIAIENTIKTVNPPQDAAVILITKTTAISSMAQGAIHTRLYHNNEITMLNDPKTSNEPKTNYLTKGKVNDKTFIIVVDETLLQKLNGAENKVKEAIFQHTAKKLKTTSDPQKACNTFAKKTQKEFDLTQKPFAMLIAVNT